MKVVLDSNIIFSALIKESTTRRLLLEKNYEFLLPQYVFEELENHKIEIIKKSGMIAEDFNKLLGLLLSAVTIVKTDMLKMHRAEALHIVKDIDKDDAIFIACVLAHPGSILWSDDKNLKKQNKVKVLNTSEILLQA